MRIHHLAALALSGGLVAAAAAGPIVVETAPKPADRPRPPRPDRTARVAALREDVAEGQPHRNLRANARRLRQLQAKAARA